MRTFAVLFLFVLLQAGSEALPIWKTGVIHTVAPSPRLSRGSPSAQQLADCRYLKQRLNDFVESTFINLCDQHDIIPEEHEWGGGQDRPFNIDEYFTLSPPEKPKKKGWKKLWEGFRALFLPSDEFKGAAGAQGVRTYLGTDGTAKGDTESSFDFTEDDTRASKTAPEAMDWANVSDTKKDKYTMHGAKGFA